MPRRIIITGANGYLGNLLIESLATRPDIQVVATGRQPHLVPTVYAADVTYLPCDLADRDQVAAAFSALDIDTLIHTAAAISAANDVAYERRSRRDNVLALSNLVQASLAAGWRRFINCSSVSVYGGAVATAGGWTEDIDLKPNTIYGRDKLEGERLLAAATDGVASISAVSLRLAGLHGGRQTSGVLYEFVAAAIAGRPLRVNEPDSQVRLLAIHDAIGALELALDSDPPLRGTYNVAGAEHLTLLELARLVCETVDSNSEIQIGDSTRHRSTIMSISKFRDTTDFAPVPLRNHIAAIANAISRRSNR